MGNVSRPLLGLLVAIVAFFALWLAALRPGSSSSTGLVPPHSAGVHSSALAPARARVPSASARSVPAPRLNAVERALAEHKVLAVLFYNPNAPDDLAVKRELAAIPTHSGRVLKLAVPLSELAGYTAITAQVQVSQSPTLVVVDRRGRASTIVGFADTFEIAQRIAGAL